MESCVGCPSTFTAVFAHGTLKRLLCVSYESRAAGQLCSEGGTSVRLEIVVIAAVTCLGLVGSWRVLEVAHGARLHAVNLLLGLRSCRYQLFINNPSTKVNLRLSCQGASASCCQMNETRHPHPSDVTKDICRRSDACRRVADRLHRYVSIFCPNQASVIQPGLAQRRRKDSITQHPCRQSASWLNTLQGSSKRA